MIAPWILDSPLKAGIATMEAGGRLGLAKRDADLRQAAQADAAAEASDRLGLSMQEMEQRRQDANARLAESLRAQTSLEQYRQSEMANMAALRQQGQQNAAATLLHENQKQKNWELDYGLKQQTEKRLADAAAKSVDFKPGQPIEVTHPVTGEHLAWFQQKSPQVYERLPEPKANAVDLTPNARLTGQLKLANPNLTKMDVNSPQYQGVTNALAQATSLLNPQPGSRPTMSDEDLAALFGGDESAATAPPAVTRLKWNAEQGDFE